MQVPVYPFWAGAGFIAALWMADRRLAARLPRDRDFLIVTAVAATGAGWLGARLLDAIVTGSRISEAGFTFYGGLIAGAAVAAPAIAWKMPPPRRRLATALMLPALCVAHALGRIGCHFAGCCYGREIGTTGERHPTSLYEAAFLFGLALLVHRVGSTRPAAAPILYLGGYGLFRFLLEFLRADDRGGFGGLSTSQWISMVLCASAVALHGALGGGSAWALKSWGKPPYIDSEKSRTGRESE